MRPGVFVEKPNSPGLDAFEMAILEVQFGDLTVSAASKWL
jgi:hypothetical protein